MPALAHQGTIVAAHASLAVMSRAFHASAAACSLNCQSRAS